MRLSAADRRFAVALACAFGGAIFFSVPLLMTMEMWWLGFSLDRVRLLVFLVMGFFVLAGLSYYASFKENFDWLDVLLDALVAFAVTCVAAVVLLVLFGVLGPDMSLNEMIGKVAVQAIPGGIGATLARSQLGQREEEKEEEKRRETYAGELFVAASGALFVALNVAHTEEMMLIAARMDEWHAVALVVGSLVLMHAFVYAVEFRGQASPSQDSRVWGEFLRLSVVGYVIALLVSLGIQPGHSVDVWAHQRAGAQPNRDGDRCAWLPGDPRRGGRPLDHLKGRRMPDNNTPATDASAASPRANETGGGPSGPPPRVPALQWAVGALGALLLLAMVGHLLVEAVRHDDGPPSIRFAIGTISPVGGGYAVGIRAFNDGDSTADALKIEGELRTRSGEVETAEMTLDHLPAKSFRDGGLFFRRDPRQHALELRPKGYSKP